MMQPNVDIYIKQSQTKHAIINRSTKFICLFHTVYASWVLQLFFYVEAGLDFVFDFVFFLDTTEQLFL